MIDENKGGGSGGSGGAGGVLIENDEVRPSINGTFKAIENLMVRFPNAKEINEDAFNSCPNIVSIDAPSATVISSNAFGNCIKLALLNLPLVTIIESYAFNRCTELVKVDLPSATTVEKFAFQGCTNLSSIILRTTKTVCVAELSALYETPMVTGQGHIYVPTAMYEYYRAGYEEALNTAMGAGAFDIIFRKIEDYPEICG
jgi:hypothetical protein